MVCSFTTRNQNQLINRNFTITDYKVIRNAPDHFNNGLRNVLRQTKNMHTNQMEATYFGDLYQLITYGWRSTYNKELMTKLLLAQRCMERCMLGITKNDRKRMEKSKDIQLD